MTRKDKDHWRQQTCCLGHCCRRGTSVDGFRQNSYSQRRLGYTVGRSSGHGWLYLGRRHPSPCGRFLPHLDGCRVIVRRELECWWARSCRGRTHGWRRSFFGTGLHSTHTRRAGLTIRLAKAKALGPQKTLALKKCQWFLVTPNSYIFRRPNWLIRLSMV